jgi:ribonucleoside-diphosphate reductase alpha chain
MNLARWEEWKDTDAVFTATIFLDCVAAEFIKKSKGIVGLEKAREFTIKGRALGLGVCGFHTYLQQKMIPFESLEAHYWNSTVFKHINEESKRATEWLANELGEPEWCKGLGIRNTHRLAIAPTKSTALLMGGVSEGINPDPAMTYTQASAGGEIQRINPILLGLMKKKGVNNRANVQEVIEARGSVQGVSWLEDEEKEVFKTAFEINQEVIIRLASNRQRFLDQGQSLNLFFAAEEDEAWIAKVHKMAFADPMIMALYYCYSKACVVASKECAACS